MRQLHGTPELSMQHGDCAFADRPHVLDGLDHAFVQRACARHLACVRHAAS